MPNEIKELYEFGPFLMDASRRVIARGQEPVALTSKAFETLLVLVRNRQRVLLKDELMKALWPDSFVEEVNLAQNISALRKALGESPGQNLYIATIPGKGYRFVGEVREIDVDSGASAIVVERRTVAQVVIREEEEDEAEAPAKGQLLLPAHRRFPRARWALLAALLLVLIAAGALWRFRVASAMDDDAGHSLAVLPFQSLSPAADDEHLGLGVTDAIITKLSNLRQLPVRPTDVVIRYADGKTDPMQAARELQVDSLLSGKIQKSDDRIRVTVQLIRVRDGQPLWARTFDEQFTSVFTVEDSISEQVAQALAVKLAEQEKLRLERHYTENIDAYRDYLQGRYAEFTFTPDGMTRAIAYFSHAISADPGYALAYAGLADAYTTESDWLLAPREALPKAEAAARKALALDDQLAEAHEALAHSLMHQWRMADADQEFHRALALNPNSVTTHYTYAEYLASTGKVEQAIAQMHTALQIDPLSPEVNSFLPWDLYLKRDFDGCLATSKKNMQAFPDLWVPHLTAGMCFSAKAQYTEAIDEFGRARAMNPGATVPLGGLGLSYARLGNRAKALKIAEEMQDMSRKTYVSPAYIGLVYEGLGDRQKEFEYLGRAYDDQAEFLLWLTFDPVFDDVKNDPRFGALVRRVGVAF